jgi:hypothetical protein
LVYTCVFFFLKEYPQQECINLKTNMINQESKWNK